MSTVTSFIVVTENELFHSSFPVAFVDSKDCALARALMAMDPNFSKWGR